MSHEAMNWALKQKGLKPATKIVLINLCDRHNPDKGCFPSKKKLSEDCEMSERSVADHLKILADEGFIRIEKVATGRSGQFASNRYILGFERDFCRGQKPPTEKSSVGRNQDLPSAKSAVDRRQNLPTNPVIEPRKGNSKADHAIGVTFSDFWERWSNKVKKADAEKAWRKLTAEERTEAHGRQVEWWKRWRAQNPQASPIHATSYLNQKRWQDEFSAPPSQPTHDDPDIERWRRMA